MEHCSIVFKGYKKRPLEWNKLKDYGNTSEADPFNLLSQMIWKNSITLGLLDVQPSTFSYNFLELSFI